MISGSKEGQDRLVRSLIKSKGFFLDIGCGMPEVANNTFNLEKIGWKGVLVDRNQEYVDFCKKNRKCPVFNLDCDFKNKTDWVDFLNLNKTPKVIDYISVDVNYSNINFVKNFPFDEYEFKIMTFETDVYKCGSDVKIAEIEVISNYDFYAMVLEDAMLEREGRVWEDWWINEKYIKCKRFYSKRVFWLDFIDRLESNEFSIKIL